ncbi:glycoside hydrolase family 2 protein [Microbacterium radiodurans]|uniref:beta-mannosidase n=1 Tax=Microbacterium radiodurans TaxID=661398 RepID=A0A5J5IMZ4_9MICO|nr:glycoside hydrolase family 2 protein [Microbacterium radiodurans]KAA9084983.1 glycoside hydrolase family 2 protein [Microbacterium radiodurans]
MTHLSPRPLHDGWTARAADGPAPAEIASAVVPAVVPGSIHVDLLAAGLIPDPFHGSNEQLLAWIGLVDWTYRTTFAWAPDGARRHDLVFDGIDTVATIRLNGEVIGEVANQHRSYRFDVASALREGENELEVAFRAPIPYANAESIRLGARPRPYGLPYEAIRKSACSFGWDWGIATYTSGLWKGVRLESWSDARLAEVRVAATPSGDGGRVSVDVRIERDGSDAAPLRVRASMSRPEQGATTTSTEVSVEVAAEVVGDDVHLDLDLEAVSRWWPVGYGDQPLYDVTVALDDAAGAALDDTARRVGFRTVVWDTTPDDAGTPFTLVVNDRPIFVKGVNWIPDDALPVRVDRARYERRLRQGLEANLNLVRIWGGGLYESDDFYDLCDELGLLVWQDFLFACAAYPEEEPLRSEIIAEARENTVRLASHASLVLLNGNNENIWGFEDWGWKLRLDGKTWGASYYYELFPEIVAELAPHVPYTPGSPFSPETQWDAAAGVQTGPHPNDEQHGSMHLWEQWNRRDWLTYRDHRPRFVAEFGWQGPPAWTTLREALDDEPLTPESPGMLVHQKAMEGNHKLSSGLIPHFRQPEDMETWHWAMQLNQALAVGAALDHFRSHAPHTAGAIVWQLNDCWPVTSWAAIDGAERAKPLFHAMRNAFAPRVVTVQPRDGGLAAVLGNDTDDEWVGELRLRRLTFAGAELAGDSQTVTVPARGSVTVGVPAPLVDAGDAASELLVAETTDARGLWYFAEPRESALTDPGLTLVTRAADGGTAVTIGARALARDVTLLVDKVHPTAHAEEALITLLPGEEATVVVRHDVAADGVLDAAALADPRVLRSANQLVVPR